MIYEQVHDLLDTHLATLAGVPTIQTENTRNTAQLNKSFVRTTLLPAKPRAITVGVSGKTEYRGLFQIDIFTKLDAGPKAANALADAIIAHFPSATPLTDAGNTIEIFADHAWRQVSRREEPYYSLPVVIEWRTVK